MNVETHIVTFEGSPPNSAMYVCTHFKARRSACYYVRNVLEQSGVYSTILHAEIPDLRCFDFLSRHETERCEGRKIAGRF